MTTTGLIAVLPDRAVVEVAGEDRIAFLQGLVSNDVALAAPGRSVWAALLTPQGKWLADFFVFDDGARLLLDAEAAQAPELVRRLSRFRLRARVALRVAGGEFAVRAGWNGAAQDPVLAAAPDPRHPEAGWRALVPTPAPAPDDAPPDEAHPDALPPKGAFPGDAPPDGVPRNAAPPNATAEDYDRHRLSLGLPDGSRDLDAEGSVLLEAGFDELSGVSWSKGCYMGQELTARTKYRGLLKRRLVPVSVEGPLPPRGTPVTRDGAEVGEMRSGRDGLGIALLRIAALEAGGAMRCGEATLLPRVPEWMRLPGALAG